MNIDGFKVFLILGELSTAVVLRYDNEGFC